MKEKDDLHQQELAELCHEIQIGIDQADRGELSPFTEETLKEAKARGRERLAAKREIERTMGEPG